MVDEFLTVAARGPSALLVEGSPGIGKTTLCLGAVDLAIERGFGILTTRPAQAESVAAYSALADLLVGADDAVLSRLPPPQMRAIDQVLLRGEDSASVTEQRAVAAAFLTAVEALAQRAPVLIVVDDIQWLDPSSVSALDYAARRFAGRVGVLATIRTGAEMADAASWLQVRDPMALRRVTLPPFSIDETSELLSRRLGAKFSRLTVSRIQEVSGGNPFYAIELGRTAVSGASDHELALPPTLSELVQSRIGDLADDSQQVLLAVACLATPTTDVIARAMGVSSHRIAELLEPAEAREVVVIDGNSVRFSHPLLAWGVHEGVSGGARRAMHRRLADAVEQPELRARHLAHGATSADEATLAALDEAAQLARSRGAPAAAAELLDLAIKLGADDPKRQIQAAAHHIESDNPVRARSLLEGVIKRVEPGQLRASAATLLATKLIYDDGFATAASLLEQFLPDARSDVPLIVQMLTGLAYMLMNTSRKRESMRRIDEAVGHAEELAEPTLLSSTLGMRVVLRFMCGAGVDEKSLARAVALDGDRSTAPIPFQPRVQRALLLAWTGELDTAARELEAIERRRRDNGEESEAEFISFHRAMVEMWRGDFVAAHRIARDMDRLPHLDGDLSVFSVGAVRSALATYAGRLDDARREARAALDASDRSGGRELAGWVVANMGFAEVSAGDYVAALTTLQPMIDAILSDPDYTEIIVASCVGDAVEALVALHRVAEAEDLVELMERNGRRLDRPWMRAVAQRGLGMTLAASGDMVRAAEAAEQAMVQHDRIPMPFEKARTQLLVGQLHRRRRRKELAARALQDAQATFERLGTSLWADRAGSELARVVTNSRGRGLTPSQQRVAELAADGMTKRAIADALFITPKTVDTNLTRIYRKLGVHSRVELARWMSENGRQPDGDDG